MILNENDIYCRDLVRESDRERYVTSLFAPPDARPALWAIYAFNHEIAKTREIVSEPMLGDIRLQWWREAIAEIYDGVPRRHAVAAALQNAVRRFGLARGAFERLIDGRALDREDAAFATMEDLIAYLDATAAPLHELALQVGDVDETALRSAARDVAVAAGLVGLARALPILLGQKRNILPRAVMADTGLRERGLYSLRPSPELAAAVARLAREAEALLDSAATAAPDAPRGAAPALLAAAQTRWHLARLEAAGHNPYDQSLARPIAFHELRLALKAWRGRFL